LRYTVEYPSIAHAQPSIARAPIPSQQGPLMPSTTYTPPGGTAVWETTSPSAAGFDTDKLQAAIAHAEASESPWPRSLYYPDGRYVGNVEWNESGPWSEISGIVRPRGGPAGTLLKGGRIVAEWGDTTRADVTFSVAKSYLSMLAGLAVGDGLIGSVDDKVGDTVRTGHFSSPHNGQITWRHLLTQSSEWDGVLWEKSDQVDHFRQVGGPENNTRKGQLRERQTPGSYYEYNDVRVNVLAFALLQRFGRPLPDVLRERIMDPIGASHDWEWHGYETSWTEVGGKRVQSVSGGSHWGGGLFIPTRDHARVGLLVSRGGRWGDRQILPADWMAQSLAPSATNDGYGFLWWLNRGGRNYPNAPHDSWFALGAGTNLIWVAPSQDLVAVVRWIDKSKTDGFFARLMAAAVR
jgi:hypothetical protein